MTKVCLSWQNIILSQQPFCHDKLIFVTTNMCLSQQNMYFVMTKVCLPWQNLSQQTCVCDDKHVFVMTNICCDKTCPDKYFCHDKHNFVTTKVLTAQAYFCHDKKILVAAPTNGRNGHSATHLVPFVSQSQRSCQLGLSSGSPHRTYPVWGSGAPADHL